MKVINLIFSCFFVCFNFVFSSNGDRLDSFRQCVKECQLNPINEPNLYLKLLFWDIKNNCKYLCMFSEETNYGKYQYYGKWPFKRIFGCQEIASVIFSIMNFYAHYNGYKKLKCIKIKRKGIKKPFSTKNLNVVILKSIFGMVAFVFSSAFHARDFLLTELFDYSAATAFVVSAFYVIASLLNIPYLYVFKRILPIIYMMNFCYFLMYRDYTVNMAFNVVVVLTSQLLWLIFAISFKLKEKLLIYRFILLTFICGSFELFDFKPVLGVFDAHSMWHFSTVWISMFYYQFLIQQFNEGY